MKTLKTTLVVTTAALLALALLASPSSADPGVDDQGVSGTLNPWNDASSSVVTPKPISYYTGQTVRIQANFTANGARPVTLYRAGTPATAATTATAHSSSGNAYFNYTVVAGEQTLFAEDSSDRETDTYTFTGVAPPPSSGLLDAPSTDGKTFKAHFTPKITNAATRLEVQRIYTAETNETDAVNPEAKKADRVGPWEPVATSKQDANGNTTFTIADPLEVKHKYRAVSGSTESNVIEFTAPLPSKATGLSQVHFNSYEGDSVNTRERYFEGEFSMTASSSLSACAAVAPIKYSTMKGRGNYSWGFDKKSFTLKIDKATDLCGLGKSKKFALVANHYDKSLLRNTVAQNVASKFTNMGWTPRSAPVDFYVNGSYRGSYILIERIAIQGPKTNDADPTKALSTRVDVDELKADGQASDSSHANNQEPNITGGYILEWDFRKGADRNVSVNDSGYVGIKDPEDDRDRENAVTEAGISPQQVSYIEGYLEDADNALKSSSNTSWQNFIDKDSAVDYYLAMELMKPVDGNMWASVYMTKPRGEKLEFGPAWDFDLAAGSANRAGNTVSPTGWYLRNPAGVSAMQSSKTWFNRLNEKQSFRDAVAARWKQVYPNLSQTSFISGQKSLIQKSADENFKKWSVTQRLSDAQVVKGSFSKEVTYLSDWMSSRRSWMNGQLG